MEVVDHGRTGRMRGTPPRIALAGAATLALVAGCVGGPTVSGPGSMVANPSNGPLRYVALGDSFTIGTAVEPAESWPSQLVAALGDAPLRLELVANLAMDGYTSGDVVTRELPLLRGLRPDFATLLVGVNDVVRGVPEATYRRNLVLIFDALLARLPATRLVVVTIPDYTVTPAGADYGDPATKRTAIRANNEIIAAFARARGVAVVDIFDLSARAATDRSLVAKDGLHPSGSQYALWVGRILPVVRQLLQP